MKFYLRRISKVFCLKNISMGIVLVLIFFVGYSRGSNKVVSAQTETCTAEFQSVAVPLTELGNGLYVRMDGTETGFWGGLYSDGRNEPPPEHLSAALDFANQIKPLNREGNYDPVRGKIVMVSIGMSNTNYEFDAFTKMVADDDSLNPSLVLVNGALPNQTADRWVDPAAIAWQELSNTLTRYEISALQVQTAWIKLTLTGGGDFPQKTQDLQADLEKIVQNLKSVYPNVKLVYLSSRVYSYTYDHGLSPEPLAYETGFAVKWLIEDQIDGNVNLNFDENKGEVLAPLLLWGPYLWADGQNAREDGLVWLQEDLIDDCTHPSRSGVEKVAGMLINFFKTNPTTVDWFLVNNQTEEHHSFLPLIVSEPTILNTLPPMETVNSRSNLKTNTPFMEKDMELTFGSEKTKQHFFWIKMATWFHALFLKKND